MSESMNILFIVWDACRLDYAKEHAKRLYELGESGLIFENAVAPSNWTRPSHTSMFNGTRPSDHGITQTGYNHMPTQLVSDLGEEDYTTYSVTGNDYLSYKTAFTDQFDRSSYTRYPQSHPGINFFRHSEEIDTDSKLESLSELVQKSIRHENRINNIRNLLRFIFHRGMEVKHIDTLRRHQYYSDMCRPRRDEKILRRMIRRESDSDNPFFIFTNDKSTHGPLVPTQELQKKHLGKVLSVSELKDLNNNLANNWAFERIVSEDEVDEADLDTVRRLYAASVEESDRSLGNLIDEIKDQGVYDDTVVIVTADHGENLGEEGIDGRRRYGHGNSINSHIFRVPLIISHPNLGSHKISSSFEMKNIYDLIRIFADPDRDADISSITGLSSEYAVCEFPAQGGMQAKQRRHPQISSKYLVRNSLSDLSAVYDGQNYVVAERNPSGEVSCKEFTQNNANLKKLYEAAITSVHELSDYSPQEYSAEGISLMEDLGYI